MCQQQQQRSVDAFQKWWVLADAEVPAFVLGFITMAEAMWLSWSGIPSWRLCAQMPSWWCWHREELWQMQVHAHSVHCRLGRSHKIVSVTT